MCINILQYNLQKNQDIVLCDPFNIADGTFHVNTPVLGYLLDPP